MRVMLRALQQGDRPHVYELLQDDAVMTFIGPRQVLSDAQAHDWFEQNMQSPERYALALKDSNELIGFCGIKNIDGIDDFGYFFRKKFWGKGLASEAIDLTVQTLRKNHDLSGVELFIADANQSSLALAKRMNWRLIKRAKKAQEQGGFYELS